MSSAAQHRHSEVLDVAALRRSFPALGLQVHGKPLVYLDNGATAQKPQPVLDALLQAYTHSANVHRGVHLLSAQATTEFEAMRTKVAGFINAPEEREVIFTRGTTESINLVAQTWARTQLQPGDEVVLTAMEHHSNIVPWQMVCKERGALLRVAPMDRSGTLDMAAYQALLGPRTRLVAVSQVSNALGTINPVQEMVAQAHAHGALVLVDGAQAVPHMPVDVQALGCDFYAFSAHKMYGPTGVGVLWGRAALLEAMPPWQGGGDMIASVTFEKTTYNVLPHKLEAGTPDIVGVIGLGAAIDFMNTWDWDAVLAHEEELMAHAHRALQAVPGLSFVGTAAHKAGVVSFNLESAHPHDVGTILDREGVAIRTGHHCAQPVMDFFGVPATCRASFAPYNTLAEIDALVAALQKVHRMFAI